MKHAPEDIGHLADLLSKLLSARGLTTAVKGTTVTARVPGGYLSADPRAGALSPGLSQHVTAIEHDGGLWWAWLWAGPSRGAPPDIEPMVPIDHVEEAARRIAGVLRVDEPEEAER